MTLLRESMNQYETVNMWHAGDGSNSMWQPCEGTIAFLIRRRGMGGVVGGTCGVVSVYGCCTILLICSADFTLSLVTNTIVFSSTPGPLGILFVGASSPSEVALDPSPTGRGMAADGEDEDGGESSQFSYRALLLRPPALFISGEECMGEITIDKH